MKTKRELFSHPASVVSMRPAAVHLNVQTHHWHCAWLTTRAGDVGRSWPVTKMSPSFFQFFEWKSIQTQIIVFTNISVTHRHTFVVAVSMELGKILNSLDKMHRDMLTAIYFSLKMAVLYVTCDRATQAHAASRN